MNNENNALLHNDVEINASEENIILAPPNVKLYSYYIHPHFILRCGCF